MKQVLLVLGSILVLFVIFHLDTCDGQSVDTKNPDNVNVGVKEPKKGERRCFKCNSKFSPTCADHFDNRTWSLSTCDVNITMCRKMIQEAYYDGSWNVRYIRQCAKHGEVGADEGRRCIERAGMYRVKMRYCHCDNKDGCNGATSVTMSYAMILPFAIAFLFNKYVHKLL